MKLKSRYENEVQVITLTVEETNQLAECLRVEIDGLDDSEIEVVVQDAYDKAFNRPEYNNYHKFDRHRGYSKAKADEEGDVIDPNEPLMEEVADKSMFYRFEKEFESEKNLQELCDIVRLNLKPENAELVISIALDNDKPLQLANGDEKKANKISHKYRRSVKKLRKILK